VIEESWVVTVSEGSNIDFITCVDIPMLLQIYYKVLSIALPI
jgi:hypothetical protein